MVGQFSAIEMEFATSRSSVVPTATHPLLLTSRASGWVIIVFSFSFLRSILLLFNSFLLLMLLSFRQRTIVEKSKDERGEKSTSLSLALSLTAVKVRVPSAMVV